MSEDNADENKSEESEEPIDSNKTSRFLHKCCTYDIYGRSSTKLSHSDVARNGRRTKKENKI